MLIVVIACLVGLTVVIVALARDDPPAHRIRRTHRARRNEWDSLPAPTEAPRLDFPLSSPGYDPQTVEVYLDAVARALADLLATAPPEVVARARRLGLVGPGAGGSDAGGSDVEEFEAGGPGTGGADEESAQPPAPPARDSTLEGADSGTDDHALRAEAALVVIETRALPSP